MDKGIHIGSWGQLQGACLPWGNLRGISELKRLSIIFEEWKVDMDSPTDTHRHLSHLIGLYPGYAITNFNSSIQNVNYTTEEVQSAAKTSLIHRGNGTGPDADSGWEKVWRAACWAQFENASEFYHELTVRNSDESFMSITLTFVPLVFHWEEFRREYV